MGMAWIQTMDVAGAVLGFTALLAALLMLGKVSTAGREAHTHRGHSL